MFRTADEPSCTCGRGPQKRNQSGKIINVPHADDCAIRIYRNEVKRRWNDRLISAPVQYCIMPGGLLTNEDDVRYGMADYVIPNPDYVRAVKLIGGGLYDGKTHCHIHVEGNMPTLYATPGEAQRCLDDSIDNCDHDYRMDSHDTKSCLKCGNTVMVPDL